MQNNTQTTTANLAQAGSRLRFEELYRVIARSFQARLNCDRATPRNGVWFENHTDTIETLVKKFMPSGSGIDCGTQFDFDASKPDRLVFTFGFHHMNDNGMYDGWTMHTAIVRPSLAQGLEITITGRDRNQIKDYLVDTYLAALVQGIAWDKGTEAYVLAEK